MKAVNSHSKNPNKINVFIISVMCIPDVNPAIIVDIMIDNSTLTLHKHSMNKQVIEMITGFIIRFNIIISLVFQ